MTEPEKPTQTECRQAVVVIHGMGEQRPMETLRSFVEAVLGSEATQADGKSAFWIVPDSRTGSAELARITTPADANGVRTDFYEFYWADIMQGTTLQHLRAWISGLLLRWPHHVPRDVMAAWIWLWIGTLVAVALAAGGLFGLIDSSPAEAAPEVVSPFWPAIVGIAVALLVAGALFYFLWERLTEEPRANASSYCFAGAAAVLVFVGIAFLLPWASILTLSVGLLLLSTVIGIVIHQLVVPYLGDVARYVRTEPETVEKRRDIRERGLALLRALHREAPPATPKDGEGADDTDDDGANAERYERIVVVGHSLGAIIAYDLLRLFWLEAGPSRDHPMGPGVHETIGALVAFLETEPDLRDERELSTYRNLQRAVSRALTAERAKPASGAPLDPGERPLFWRISDLVTLGSPLTHAEFLLARDLDRLAQLVEERQIATSPPLPVEGNDFRYRPDDHRLHLLHAIKEQPPGLPHHAAMFAATRWTNIYDRHSKVLLGDIVSGPVQSEPASTELREPDAAKDPGMGLGIRDRHIRIRRRSPIIPGLGRFFTHTLYWDCKAEGILVCGDIHPAYRASGPHPRQHVEVLREAMALDEPLVAEQPVARSAQPHDADV
ncbi:MAG TPA: hypothetical protein VIN77_05500 [Aurantimonas sp.]